MSDVQRGRIGHTFYDMSLLVSAIIIIILILSFYQLLIVELSCTRDIAVKLLTMTIVI
jgi:hypothetical protein